MNNQHDFPHGLLYSVAPESISTLHLNDDELDDLDWGANDYGSIAQLVFSFMKKAGRC